MQCANNLHQIGLGLPQLPRRVGGLPKYRRCPDLMKPDPLTGQIPDVDCNSLTSPTTYTGPNEVWWAPYDNRPGSNVCQPLDDNYPRGLLWPYIEQNPKIFKCPRGIDIDPASTTFGQEFQCSYGMNYVTGGPNGKRLVHLTNGNGTSNIVIVWDHGRTPGCANSKVAAPRGPWVEPGGGYVLDSDVTHYPVRRHEGVFNVLYLRRAHRPPPASPSCSTPCSMPPGHDWTLYTFRVIITVEDKYHTEVGLRVRSLFSPGTESRE